MELAEYRVLLSRANTRLLALNAIVKKGGSDWCSFVEGTVETRGIEIYASDDKEGLTVDFFRRGEAFLGERDFENLDLALESAINWLCSGILPN